MTLYLLLKFFKYLFEKERESERDRDRDINLLSTIHFPNVPKQSGLGQVEVRSLGFNLHHQTGHHLDDRDPTI